jgi:tetratricopeptide (TPR) repeat protein
VPESLRLARVWLGPGGGGPVVAGTRKRSLVPATQGTKAFLDRERRVPVAAAGMFVGRRQELQRVLRALRSGERAGVLLHGQGRLGKSSLAARIADRCPEFAAAVVFGDYSALAILDAVAAAVRAPTRTCTTRPAPLQQAETGGGEGTSPLDRARVIAGQARRLITRGELDQAEPLLRHAYQLFEAAGSEREAAVAMGDIANIAFQRGDYDQAPELQQKVLEANKQRGDLDGIAATDLVSRTSTVEIRTLGPDQLLDLLDGDGPAR